MTITGSTQAVSVVLSLARMKALAVLLGPAGVGVLSIYNGLQSTAATLAGLGIGGSAVRQIVRARGDEHELSRVRQVLLVATLLQGALATLAIWLLREPIAAWLFGSSGFGFEVGIVGVAVLLTLITSSQTALLRGTRRIADLGRVTVIGALAGTIGGIAAVWASGMGGLLWFVVMQPLIAVLVAAHFTRKLPKSPRSRLSGRVIWQVWRPMFQLGAGFMFAGLATTATLLLVRSTIANQLGLDAAGQFAAAWGITMTYVGFLLSAMGMDYYPRLSEVIDDKPAANRLINEQMQISLTIGGPVLLLLIGIAPLAIPILYSDKFGEAITLLQWQTAGNLFKLASWSMSFCVPAAARPKTYLLMEASFLLPLGSMIYLLLPRVGLGIAGIAFLVSYIIYFVVAHRVARNIVDFRLESLSLGLMLGYGGGGLALLALSLIYPRAGILASLGLSAATAFVGGHILMEKIGPHRYTAPLARAYAALGWPLSDRV